MSRHRKPSIVIREIAELYDLEVDVLVGRGRGTCRDRARAHLAHILYSECGRSLAEVGKIMGNRDHTTILHIIHRHLDREAAHES